MSPAAKTAAPEIVWNGASALRPFLVPIADLEPFPGNPRRGDVELLRESLREFGQTRAVLTDATNPNRIVAAHHIVLAARAEGWTHVAAIPNEFESEEKARRYLLIDNRSHDRGSYDVDLLYAQLKDLQAKGGLAGTGYDEAYVSDLDQQMEALRRELMAPPEFPPLDPDELDTSFCCPNCHYEWSGDPRAGAPDDDGDEPEAEPEPEPEPDPET